MDSSQEGDDESRSSADASDAPANTPYHSKRKLELNNGVQMHQSSNSRAPTLHPHRTEATAGGNDDLKVSTDYDSIDGIRCDANQWMQLLVDSHPAPDRASGSSGRSLRAIRVAATALNSNPRAFIAPSGEGAGRIIVGLAAAIAETSAMADLLHQEKSAERAEARQVLSRHRDADEGTHTLLKGRTQLPADECILAATDLMARCGRTALGGDVYEVLRWSLGNPDFTLVCPLS